MTSFNLFSKRNIILTLSAALVVAFGFMAMYNKKPTPKPVMTYEQEVQKLETQGDSDSINSIEKDLNETNIDDADKELMDIETELNASVN